MHFGGRCEGRESEDQILRVQVYVLPTGWWGKDGGQVSVVYSIIQRI